MTGKTHRVGGVLCVLGGYLLLESRGMLLGNVSPLVQLAVMYPFAVYGSTVSDLDHDWSCSPSKDVVSMFINKILHLSKNVIEGFRGNPVAYRFLSIFNSKHRSWQTHSDLFLVVMVLVTCSLLNSSSSSVDTAIIRLVFTGLILGIISHLLLDMLTPEGIWCFMKIGIGKLTNNKYIRRKISLVPNTRFFRTGGAWEEIVRNVMGVICIVLFIRILYISSSYVISFGG